MPPADLIPKLVFLAFAASLFSFCMTQAQTFQRSTLEAGINLQLLPETGTNGVSVADYNRDGNPDIYFVTTETYNPANKGTWNLIFRGLNDHTFREINTDIGLYGNNKGTDIEASYMGKKLGASWGDFNNDGFPDLYLTHAGPDQLLVNNTDGTFRDITESAGVAGGNTQMSSTALWFDYDSDGDLDLYVAVWEDYSQSGEFDTRNRMYENTGNGSFLDVSEESGLDDPGKTWMSLPFDFNKDGLLDLYLANDFGENKLYINSPEKKFREETERYGLTDVFEGMGLAIGDPNGDGLFDMYLTNVTEKPSQPEQINPLFIQNADTTFTNLSVDAGVPDAGWGWGTQFMDLDNDMDEDLFVVNGYFESAIEKNRLFINQSARDSMSFTERAEEAGIADLAESRTFVPFDYNNDGALDLLISNFTQKPYLYKNTQTEGNWLNVSLEGILSNRNGFGAILELEAGGKFIKRYYHGAHFFGQSILPVHFGLGEISDIDRLTVHWLSGQTDTFTSLNANQYITVREAAGIVTSIERDNGNHSFPKNIQLIRNYPNPFNGTTHIQFELAKPGVVKLEIYNLLGQMVYSMNRDFTNAGTKTIAWQTDQSKSSLNSGIFFYRLTDAYGFSENATMLYLK